MNDGSHGLELKNGVKTETTDEHESIGKKLHMHGDYSSSQPSFSSASSSSSLSNFNEPSIKMNNQHISNMISSYNKAGKYFP